MVNAGNSVVSYEYDGMNRPWKRKYWAGSSCANKGSLLRTIEVGYIGGRIDYIKDDKVGGTALDYEYDEYFRVSSVEQTVCADAGCGSTVGETVYYEYDAGDRVTRMATADGETVEYGYYDDGSLRVVSRNGTTVAEYEYDQQGARSKVTRYRADGVTTSSATEYGYDEQGRLTDIHHKDGSTTLSRYQYEYDSGANAKGQRTAQARTLSGSSVRVEYEYDSFYRLSRAGTWDGSTLEYEYDTLGNILSVTEVDGGFDLEEETYFYDSYGMNRLEAIWYDMDADGDTSEPADYVVRYDYNDAGSMSARDVINGTTTVEARDYYYDADDMLVEVKEGSTTVVEYVYDALGRRVLKDLGTEETIYFYDGEDIVQTCDGATVVGRYVHGPGIDDVLQDIESGGSNFILTDGLGSLTELEANGSLTMRSEYSPFGDQSITYDPNSIGLGGYGYTGREYDEETGLMYYRSRYYSTEQRRFVQEDKFAGILIWQVTFINKYTYVINDPINYTDPMGLYIGQLPPYPKGYNPDTWIHGFRADRRTGKLERYLQDPETGRTYRPHAETDSHFRHNDWTDPGGGKGGRDPKKSLKRRPNQKRPAYGDQSETDPNGCEPEGWGIEDIDRWDPDKNHNAVGFSEDPLLDWMMGYGGKYPRLFFLPIIPWFPIPGFAPATVPFSAPVPVPA